MSSINLNLKTLNEELAWLEQVINCTLQSYFNQDQSQNCWQDIQAPTLDNQSAYGSFVLNHSLDSESRLALALAIAPNLKPQLLDAFLTKNTIIDNNFSEFGGYKDVHHNGFLPTFQTLLFILSIKDSVLSTKVFELLQPEHVLRAKEVLQFVEMAKHLPKLNAVIALNTNGLNYFLTGKLVDQIIGKQLGDLLVTPLNWQDLVLTPNTADELVEILEWYRHRQTLMQDWDLHQKLKPGYRVLFYGAEGTGKRLAAAALGRELACNVYLVSSEIFHLKSEDTVKKLKELFKLATQRNAILYFAHMEPMVNRIKDEVPEKGDLLFLELLQNFPGLAILSINVDQQNIEKNLPSYFQNYIHFPKPNAQQRLRLWQNAFNGKLKLATDIDLAAIADKYELTGQSIDNILRYCAIKTVASKDQTVSFELLSKAISKHG
ncbi:ATP-binding protein [Nubsella zeaxanthinifaciens]|uniref:ATP-binding protein n=1 Tax=Nubsella zeaxanthinifaciens TaxID=392412 RepID=UPI003D078A4A